MASKSILILEDDPDLFHALARAIRRQLGNRVGLTWVASVKDAKQALKEQSFEAIISDVLLKGDRTGLDFWREMNRSHPKMPFILMSALPSDRFVEWMKGECFPPAFLPKPFQLSDLTQIIQERVNL